MKGKCAACIKVLKLCNSFSGVYLKEIVMAVRKYLITRMLIEVKTWKNPEFPHKRIGLGVEGSCE